MSISIADNFSYQGKKPLDGRQTYATVAAMKSVNEATVYDGIIAYVDTEDKYYKFLSSNTVDPTTGKWREYTSGGGTTVVPNPEGEPTDTLTKLQIGNDIYAIAESGMIFVQIPSVVGNAFTYDGTAQGPTVTGLNTEYCTVTGATATNAGTYTLTIALKDPTTTAWADLTQTPKTYSYTIAKKSITIPTVTSNLVYDGTQQAPTIVNPDSAWMTTSGDTEATNAGTYTVTFTLDDTSNTQWSDNTTAAKSSSWSIAKASQTITASTNSISLDINTPSASVTISGANTSLNVSSSAPSIATVSGTSSPITITAVADGSATISVQAASSSNYEASNTVTIAVSVALYRTVSVTVYSAANDTLSYIDETGSKTLTTDSSGVGTASVVIPPNGRSVTFTSSVAKQPSDLSSDYSKTFTITESTSVYVMPNDNVLYWYGYHSSNFEICSTANGWAGSTSYTNPSFNTNKVILTSSGTGNMSAIGSKNALSNISKYYAIYKGLTSVGGHCGVLDGISSKTTSGGTVELFTSTGAIALIENSVSASYVWCGSETGRSAEIYALYYE